MAKTETEPRVLASFDVNSREGKVRILNAKSGSSISLKSLETGTELKIVDALIYEDNIKTYDKDGKIGRITVLYAKDGTSYAGVSEPVSKATEGIIELLQDPDFDELNVKIVQGTSAGGNKFLNLAFSI